MQERLETDVEALETRILRLVETLRRSFARDLAHFGLTFPQFITLCFLERAEGKAHRIGALAAATLQSAASMTGIVDRLTERGLVERQRDAKDRRSVVVGLTEEGERLLYRIREERRRGLERLLHHLSDEERAQLSDILDKLLRGME